MATPLGEEGFEDDNALEQLTHDLCARVLSAEPLSSSHELVKELLVLEPDTEYFRGLDADLIDVFLRGTKHRDKFSYGNAEARLADPSEPPFGVLKSGQMDVLLRTLCALLPLSKVVVASKLLAMLPVWLQVDGVAAAVGAALQDLALAAATQSRVLCAALVRAALDALPREPPAPLMAALSRIITTSPAAAYDVVSATVTSSDGVVLLAHLGCAGGVFPPDETTHLLAAVLAHAAGQPSLHAVIKSAVALCIVLPHSMPAGSSLAHVAIRGCVLRLLRWPHDAEDGCPATADRDVKPGEATIPAEQTVESPWMTGLVRQSALSLLQTCYWAYPTETLECVRGLAIEDGAGFAEIRGWMMETTLHPKLVDCLHTDTVDSRSPTASPAFVISQCASSDGLLHNPTVVAAAAGANSGKVTAAAFPPGPQLPGLLADADARAHASTAPGKDPTITVTDVQAVSQLLTDTRARAQKRRKAARTQSGPVDAMLMQLRAALVSTAPQQSGLAQIRRDLILAQMQIVYLEHVRTQQLHQCRSQSRRLLDVATHAPSTVMPAVSAVDDVARMGSSGLRPVMSTSRRSSHGAEEPGAPMTESQPDEPTADHDSSSLLARIRELEDENARLKEERTTADAAAATEREALEVSLEAERANVAILTSSEDVLRAAAGQRHELWGKLDDLTLTCHAWEDSAADYLQIAEHYTQLQRQCHVLELKHDSAAGELAQARAEVVEKDIKLAMAVAEKTDLQNKTVDATIALEHQTTALEAMQVQSAAKLRAVESKYATQKGVNIALQLRILELSAAVDLSDNIVKAAEEPSPSSGTEDATQRLVKEGDAATT